MLYVGNDLNTRGLAFSEDGITWIHHTENPIIDESHFPISGTTWDTALVHRDGMYLYFMEIGSPPALISTWQPTTGNFGRDQRASACIMLPIATPRNCKDGASQGCGNQGQGATVHVGPKLPAALFCPVVKDAVRSLVAGYWFP